MVTVKLVVYGTAAVNAAWPAYKAALRVQEMTSWYREFRKERTAANDPWVWVDIRRSKETAKQLHARSSVTQAVSARGLSSAK